MSQQAIFCAKRSMLIVHFAELGEMKIKYFVVQKSLRFIADIIVTIINK